MSRRISDETRDSFGIFPRVGIPILQSASCATYNGQGRRCGLYSESTMFPSRRNDDDEAFERPPSPSLSLSLPLFFFPAAN